MSVKFLFPSLLVSAVVVLAGCMTPAAPTAPSTDDTATGTAVEDTMPTDATVTPEVTVTPTEEVSTGTMMTGEAVSGDTATFEVVVPETTEAATGTEPMAQ